MNNPIIVKFKWGGVVEVGLWNTITKEVPNNFIPHKLILEDKVHLPNKAREKQLCIFIGDL